MQIRGRRLASAACGLLVAIGLSATALAANAAAATWNVAYPPYSNPNGGVPYAPLLGTGAITASDVWAVGEVSGSPLSENWNGSKWASVALPGGPCSVFENSCILTGVSGDAAGDVFAVGHATINSDSAAGWVDEPLAFHWNGSAWSPMTLPSAVTPFALESIEAFSLTDAWAVGVGPSASGTSTVATAVQWNGTSWNEVTTPISTANSLSINGISGSSPSDIWVVGETSTSGYRNRQVTSVIMHYNGASWSLSNVHDSSGLISVDAVSPTDAWAVAADGSVLSWNGSAWTVQTQESGAKLVQALSPTDVWVGGIVSLGHYNGSAWSTAPTPSTFNAFSGGAALAPGHVWFVGISYLSNGDEVPAVLATSNG